MTRSSLCRLFRARRGNAAIEFALIGSIFAVLLLNIVDFAFLIWSQMEVDHAAEAGVQAAYNTCSSGTMPATTNCPTMNSVITNAAQSTSLGSSVTLASGSPAEAYYCTAGTTLQPPDGYPYNEPPSPFDCSQYGNPTTAPGDYVRVSVNYSFTPLFGGLSFVGTQTLSGSGMQRLQ